MFFSLLTFESWCCYGLVAAQISAIFKRRGTFPCFRSDFVYLFLQFCFRFCCCQWALLRFLLLLKVVTGSFWKVFFRDSLTDSRFWFFRIILVIFGQHLLYVIAKGMRMLIDVSFYVTRVRISRSQLAICEAFWQFANAFLRFF